MVGIHTALATTIISKFPYDPKSILLRLDAEKAFDKKNGSC